jgi:hypothetical protein
MSFKHPAFELPITQDLRGRFEEIQSPEPFNEAFWSDFVDHHLPNDLKVVKAFEQDRKGSEKRS